MGKFRISDSDFEYSPSFDEEEEVYSYQDDSSKESKSSERSINNNDVPSNESSSSSEAGSSKDLLHVKAIGHREEKLVIPMQDVARRSR